MTDSGFTQINDVVLNIPPEQINIDRKSLNYSWQALRTTSSIKTKSGYSQLDISMRVMFTGEDLGYVKLRNLIAQFRVTPFCYIENKYLRDQIMGGVRGKNMALALKSMTINKAADENPDVVEVVFYFSWFNYLPYTSDFTFKSEPFLAVEVKDPRNSKAWKLMYQAEINRARRLYRFRKGLYRKITTESLGENPTRLEFTEYKLLTVSQYRYFKREVSALRKLRAHVKSALGNQNDIKDIIPQMYSALKSRDANGQQLLSDPEAEVLIEELFGSGTSLADNIYNSKNAVQEVFSLLNGQLSSSSSSRFRNILDQEEWKASLVGVENPEADKTDVETTLVDFPGRPDSLKSESSNDNLLVERQRVVLANSVDKEDDIILTGISISFQNILAVLPIKGFTYPTFQHIGSVDAVVSLSFVVTNEIGAKKLNEFYGLIEEQANTLKQLPQGHRNLLISNDLINMCGLAEFIPDSISTQTIPGMPGHSAVNISLLNNPITSTTRERLVETNSLIGNADFRTKVAKILTNNLRLIDNAFSIKDPIVGAKRHTLRSLKYAPGIINKKNKEQVEETLAKYPSAILESEDNNKITARVKIEAGYFIYKGSSEGQHQRFRELCIEYGRRLGGVLELLMSDILKMDDSSYNKEYGHIFELFALSEQDVLSIEVLKEVFNAQITKNKSESFDYLINPGRSPERFEFTSQDSYEETKKIIQDYRFVGPRQGNISFSEEQRKRINEYINQELADWVSWSENFIDKILSTDFITLPQFADILAEIDLASEGNQVTAYPDFPLGEVISLLQQDKEYNKLLLEMQTNKFKVLSSGKLKSRALNSNIASLIGPDFYFFNRIGDARSNLIGSEKIEGARQAIHASHSDKRVKAEEDWFSNVYEPNIVGAKYAEDIREARANLGKGYFDDALKKTFSDADTNILFTASDLVNDGEDGLTCSIAARAAEKEPISLTSIDSGWEAKSLGERDHGSGWTTNSRSGGELTAPSYYAEAKHRYGVDALDFVAPSLSTNPEFKGTNSVEWGWPTGPQTRRITSPFNLNRPHPVLKVDDHGNVFNSNKHPHKKGMPKVRPHLGMDLGSTDRKGSRGHPVLAAADGEVTYISYSTDEWAPGVPMGTAGYNIVIRHKNGYATRYMHLEWDTYFEELRNMVWGPPSEFTPSRVPVPVRRGYQIGSVGNSGGISSAPHLHFEVLKNGKHIDPETIFNPQVEKLTEIFMDDDPQNKSLLNKSAAQFEKDLTNGQGFGMIRAYPTYRLYFIESDLDERKRFKFDDFFSYSSVVSIELIRSRKLAADLLILRLTNTSGVLNNRRFRNSLNPDKARDAQGNIAKEESPIASLMLKTGTQIQLALGYSSDTSQLEIPFNGVITDIQFSGGDAMGPGNDEIVDITCQSFGLQLVQSIHGKVKKFGGFLSDTGITGEICEQLIAEPEITHFGRWTPGKATPLGDRFRSILTDRWTFTPQPADDNIFAPTGRGIWGIFDSTPNFILYHTTVWDAMQELTLRHPSMIAYPVPYEGKYGPRMTMFFGVPDQMYFSRDPTPREMVISERLRQIASDAADQLDAADLGKMRDANLIPDANLFDSQMGASVITGRQKAKEFFIKEQTRRLALATGVVQPFRKYHLLSSNQHILHNSINNSLHNVFNTVTLQYDSKGAEVDDDGNARSSLKFSSGILGSNKETYTLRCDAALPDEEVREMFAQFPNCVGDEMAKRYCLSLLKHSLREGYKGSVTIIGNPRIKPYDVCYLFDQHNDMYGPIEVEQVVLSFSQQTGFITEITPDMCVHVNEHTTMATQDALGLIAESWMKDSLGFSGSSSFFEVATVAGTGLAIAAKTTTPVGALSAVLAAPIANMFYNSSELAVGHEPTANPLKLIGGFIFSKAITRTQLAHPMRYSPLVKGGQPMMGGLPKQLDITFMQGVEKWFKDSYKGAGLLISDTIDKLSPNAWANHSTGNFEKTILDKGRG